MGRFLAALIAVIVIIGGGFLYFNTKQAEAPAPSENIIVQPPPPPPRSLTIQLSEQNKSGESGTATLTEENGKTKVVLALSKITADILPLQPAHIHQGTCAKIGAVDYPLTGVFNGSSETVVNATFDELTGGGVDRAINVHQSQQKANVYVACGDLTMQRGGESTSEKIIEIGTDGFSPSTLTIKAGTKVTIKNMADADSWPASAVHPTHKAYPGSDIGLCITADIHPPIFDACRGLKKGETFSFTFDQKGTWFYHDHMNTKHFGKIVVE